MHNEIGLLRASRLVFSRDMVRVPLLSAVVSSLAGRVSLGQHSTVLTHVGLVKEVDEGDLATPGTLRKRNTGGWLFHVGNAPFDYDDEL